MYFIKYSKSVYYGILYLVAHRLSTVKRADRIVVIDKGQVVETGNHKELCSMVDGIYKRLWREQVDEID